MNYDIIDQRAYVNRAIADMTDEIWYLERDKQQTNNSKKTSVLNQEIAQLKQFITEQKIFLKELDVNVEGSSNER